MKRFFVLVVLLVTVNAHATVYDLGVVGQTYEIAEPDMLQSFYSKLRKAEAEGKMAEVEADMKQRFIDHANRPKGIALPRAETHRVRYYDPSTVLSQDIVDHEGNVLWPAGTKVNPLEYIAMSQQWLFFDGNDPEQTTWAQDYLQRFPNQVRPILIQGAVLELAKAWDTGLYFDQHGTYVKKFGIKAVPAILSQEGKKLRIDEVVPND
ncbi:MAG: type-F conjugative transfer system protein TraW [Candidatus Thiodiazotropha sp. LLP2]|nr:type-F conjugative transfer system protein TraW [Candidatus Thiodiazotropha lotti]MCG8013259.1 type-F conjugative transfer system protein TraW [Candidatus Thiodiazotropha lotti]MCW4212732.1 type-F conjugative transfer system protein TraW [Candidatus Thiodiazotropha lotti]MCW4216791.1 type-F conjugative transfer system protein TraW [Candidatus Thiodiazotropha lotti]